MKRFGDDQTRAEQLVRRLSEEGGPSPAVLCCVRETESTMDLAAELCAGAGSPVAVFADRQTQGRGRLGRPWAGPQGALLYTLGAVLGPEAKERQGLSLAVGVEIAKTLETFSGERSGIFRLKWPNDLLTAHGKKVAGVLVELRRHASTEILLIGVGLNVSASPEEFPMASSVAEALGSLSLPVPNRDAIGAQLTARLLTLIARFPVEGLAPWRADWLARAHRIGDQVFVSSGDDRIAGTFRGIGSNGELQLQTGDDIREIFVGDVSYAARV